jgi:hypothetical protein
MIVTKATGKVKGYIEYSYELKREPFDRGDEEEDGTQYESDTFSTLTEMLEKLKPEVLEEVRESVGAIKVWISCISLDGKSEDGDTTAGLSLYSDRKRGTDESRGHLSTKINNEDVDSRLMLNLNQIKRILDNTLEEYPVSY